MKVRMKKTVKGSPDGINVFEYEIGKSYDLPEELVKVFLKEKWAIQDKSMEGPKETKKKK
jgi:hypothetical protein